MIDFDDKIIISLLNKNKNNVFDIEELKLENCHFTHELFSSLVNLFPYFKHLLKLSINKIDFKVSYQSIMEDITLYDYIPNIFKNIPTIIELDFSNNKYEEKIFYNKIFKEINSYESEDDYDY